MIPVLSCSVWEFVLKVTADSGIELLSVEFLLKVTADSGIALLDLPTLASQWWWLFPRVREYWENECATIHSLPVLSFFISFFLCFFFFFFFGGEVEISSSTVILLLISGSVHSGSASCDDCGRLFADELRVSSFPDRFPRYACTAA